MKAAPRPTFPWIAVIVVTVVVAIGSFVLIDMKPWSARKFEPAPTSTLKILGRDDPATLSAQQAEREEERRRRQRPRPSASASSSAAPAPSASQNTTAEPMSSARP